ncbi:uncharacterized protein LOC106060598 [Biomphalaria glabrata]|uniref:Uncharacterized protein LOC106060598 n=1 Tax=Biomphalaria glabrata TaxID=6526 RepID=A0A9W2YV55_BIOGL|nr:uncharacterized protein LOC106060598 [Biomphalaria glabrata]XP_055866602.1 uncharacterized protein LOC106060598 [Biomphalaria glabrata]
MAEYEAGLDSNIDVYIQYPESADRVIKTILIADVNGVDYKVEQVKNNILNGNSVPNAMSYNLAFRNESNGNVRKVDQSTKMLDWLKILTSSETTLIFQLI